MATDRVSPFWFRGLIFAHGFARSHTRNDARSQVAMGECSSAMGALDLTEERGETGLHVSVLPNSGSPTWQS